MLTTPYAKALPDIRVNAADPGYTATDINQNEGYQTVAEGFFALTAAAPTTADQQRAPKPASARRPPTAPSRATALAAG